MIEFYLGCAFMLVMVGVTVLLLLKMGLLKNHDDVTSRFEAHRELVMGTLGLMRERMNEKVRLWEQVFETKLKGEAESLRKDLDDARAAVMTLHDRSAKLEGRLESLTGGILPGENRPVPSDMEVVGGGAIGND